MSFITDRRPFQFFRLKIDHLSYPENCGDNNLGFARTSTRVKIIVNTCPYFPSLKITKQNYLFIQEFHQDTIIT